MQLLSGYKKSKRTSWRIVVGNFPITIEGDTNNTVLLGFELFTIELDSTCMRVNQVVSDTDSQNMSRSCESLSCTYIQGSVRESPSAERVRSLLRPGANTPRPKPRTATHQGSLMVSLTPEVRKDVRVRMTTHQCLTLSPYRSKHTRA